MPLTSAFFDVIGLRQERDESMAEQFRERENRLQGRMLKMASDATELQFEFEQIKRDVPRLQVGLDLREVYLLN